MNGKRPGRKTVGRRSDSREGPETSILTDSGEGMSGMEGIPCECGNRVLLASGVEYRDRTATVGAGGVVGSGPSHSRCPAAW